MRTGQGRVFLIREPGRKDESGHPGFRGRITLSDNGWVHIHADRCEYLDDGGTEWDPVEIHGDTISLSPMQVEQIEWGDIHEAEAVGVRRPRPRPSGPRRLEP